MRFAIAGCRGAPPPLLGLRPQRGVARFVERKAPLAAHVGAFAGGAVRRGGYVHIRGTGGRGLRSIVGHNSTYRIARTDRSFLTLINIVLQVL